MPSAVVPQQPASRRADTGRREPSLGHVLGTVVGALAVVGAPLAGAAVPAHAAASSGAELRRSLPGPGEPSLRDTREFAGLERRGRRAFAVVVHRDGSAVAFVCDGATSWRWLTGRVREARLTLRGEQGARLTGIVTRARVTGVLRLAGKSRHLVLARSIPRAGLRRVVDGRFEGAWILTNGGQIRGVGTIGKTTVISSSADATEPTEDEGTTAAGEEDVAARLLTKARCTVILLKTVPLRFRVGNGTATEQDQLDLAVLFAKFSALHCPEVLGGTMP